MGRSLCSTNNVSSQKIGETRLQTILEGLLGAVVTIDSNGIIKAINPIAERTFGYTTEEVVGAKIGILFSSALDSEFEKNLVEGASSDVVNTDGFRRRATTVRKTRERFPVGFSIPISVSDDGANN